MSGIIITNPIFHADGPDGAPLVGGKLYTYAAGTTTLKNSYSDYALSALNTNPVILNSRGEAAVYGDGMYKLVLYGPDDVLIWTHDTYEVGLSGNEGLPIGVNSSGNGYTALETQRMKVGADVTGSGVLTLGAGNIFDVTGTGTYTSIATKGVGCVVVLQFDGASVLTHHATDLILAGGANITTAAGDVGTFYEYATGDWRCVAYSRASGLPLAFIDEDSMVTDSAAKVPSQQSVKSYIDSLTGLTITPFTPYIVDLSNSAAEGQTYGATNYGSYRKIGGMVFFDVILAVTSIGTLTTTETVTIRGLPVPPVYQSFEASGGGVNIASGLAVTAGNSVTFSVLNVTGEAAFRCYKWSATTGTSYLTYAELSGDGVLVFSGCYPYR